MSLIRCIDYGKKLSYVIALSLLIIILIIIFFCIRFNEKKYSLIIYNTNSGSVCYSSFIDEAYECSDSEDLGDIHIEIKVANPDALILDYFSEYLFNKKVGNGNYVLYYDNSVYLYDAQTKKSKSLNINFDEWDFYHIERENESMLPHGIVCGNEKNDEAYYNLENDTIMYRGYNSISYAGYGFLSASKRKCVDGKYLMTFYLLSSQEEKVIDQSEEVYAYGGFYTVEYTDGELNVVSHFLPWNDDDEKVYCK